MTKIEQGKSTSECLIPLLQCLKGSEEILGDRREWNSSNPQAQKLLKTLTLNRDIIEQFSDLLPELKHKVSFSAEELNAFLRAEGFQNIRLNPFTNPGEFGVASVLKVFTEWLHEGTDATIVAQDSKKTFKGFKLNGNKHRITAFSADSGNHIYTIPTKDPTTKVILLTDTNQDTGESVDFTELYASKKRFIRRNNIVNFSNVIIPEVALDHQPDISWLIGTYTQGKDGVLAIITQALQQTKFNMNKFGASVESAAAIAVSRGISAPPPDLTIDKPFYTFVVRDGIDMPIFSGYLDTDSWTETVK